MSRTTSSSSSFDAFDELASMFMTPADAKEVSGHADAARKDAPASADTMIATFTELLLVGHLPVRGNLWLTPYADALARDVGPVALIRLDGDEPTLEIVRGREAWRSEIAGRPLQEVIASIAGDIRAWIIRPRAINGLSSTDVTADVDRLMLLSSADQAAVVSAYQTIKQLKHHADEEGADLPQIGMTVVGCQPESATWMVRRLQATAMSQLDVSIALDRVLPRIDSEIESSVYLRFADAGALDVPAIVAMIDDATLTVNSTGSHDFASPPPSPSTHLTPNAANGHAPLKPEEVETLHEPVSAHDPIEWDPIIRPGSAGAKTEANRPVGTSSIGIKLAPKPTQQSTRREGAEEHRSPDDEGMLLASHVPGLTPVELRCPRIQHVEFAVDERGGLHLLANEMHLRELRIAESWARSHRELIAMAIRDHAVTPEATITCHLVTSEPASVADLHGTEIKLHVLAPVEVEGRTGWYVAALNR